MLSIRNNSLSYFCFFFLFVFLNSHAQTIGNYENAVSIIAETATTPSTPNSYQWQEVTERTQGIQVSVVPPEQREIYIQQTDSYINFNTFYWGIMFHLSVKYDNGNWQTIFNNQSKIETGWLSNPFSTLGKHTITIKWIDVSADTYYRDYDVYVVKNYNKLYKDNYGNTLTCWSGNGNQNSIIVSEGFDPYNSTYAEYLSFKASQLFEPLQQGGYNIYILNYKYNSQDIRNSAAIYTSAINYVSSINNHTQMISVGVSMGGVIARYSLTKAEDNGSPLPVKSFVSIDSPQQGAIISETLQNYLADNNPSDFQKHGLDNTAAKQLLLYNTYGNLNSSFYNELNALNGWKGYPSITKNYGISFSNGTPNNSTGVWVSITFKTIFDITKTKSFSLTQAETTPGSYFPRSLVASNPTPLNVFYFIGGMVSINRTIGTNPTFIPYYSALDIVGGVTF